VEEFPKITHYVFQFLLFLYSWTVFYTITKGSFTSDPMRCVSAPCMVPHIAMQCRMVQHRFHTRCVAMVLAATCIVLHTVWCCAATYSGTVPCGTAHHRICCERTL